MYLSTKQVVMLSSLGLKISIAGIFLVYLKTISVMNNYIFAVANGQGLGVGLRAQSSDPVTILSITE